MVKEEEDIEQSSGIPLFELAQKKKLNPMKARPFFQIKTVLLTSASSDRVLINKNEVAFKQSMPAERQ